jgi:hypothetical protein
VVLELAFDVRQKAGSAKAEQFRFDPVTTKFSFMRINQLIAPSAVPNRPRRRPFSLSPPPIVLVVVVVLVVGFSLVVGKGRKDDDDDDDDEDEDEHEHDLAP